MLVEGGVLSAVAVAYARRKPRATRVRREPIDIDQLTTELAVAGPRRNREQDLADAIEAEILRINLARKDAVEPEPAPALDAEPDRVLDDELVLEPDVIVLEAEATPLELEPRIAAPFSIPVAAPLARAAADPPDGGLPIDQVRAWLEQVKDDLRKVQARVQLLELEQVRLQGQHHLVTELVTSSNAA